MYELMVESSFSAAHQLRDYEGKCETLHGHNWKVQVWVQGEQLQPNGILIDFCDLKTMVEKVTLSIDHSNINELPGFETLNPTSENLARYIFQELRKLFNHDTIKIVKVAVWETEKNMGAYFEQVKGSP